MTFEIPSQITQLPRFDTILFSLIAFLVAYIVGAIIKRTVRFIVSGVRKRETISPHFKAKARTVTTLLYSIVDVLVYTVTLLVVLAEWNIDITPIIASAGVIGLAVSFGSQTLIKDIISGIFIILEDQYNVGDRVKIGTNEGEVKRVTLRLTVLKDDDGNFIYMPNSTITSVTRMKVAPDDIKPAAMEKKLASAKKK